jgi:hypothetical protein
MTGLCRTELSRPGPNYVETRDVWFGTSLVGRTHVEARVTRVYDLDRRRTVMINPGYPAIVVDRLSSGRVASHINKRNRESPRGRMSPAVVNS